MKAVPSLALKPCRTQLSCALLRCSSNPAADRLCSFGAQADTWETPAGGCIWVAFRTHGITSRLRVGFPVQHFTSWSSRIVQTGSKRTQILAPPDFKTLLSRALVELQHMSFTVQITATKNSYIPRQLPSVIPGAHRSSTQLRLLNNLVSLTHERRSLLISTRSFLILKILFPAQCAKAARQESLYK